MYKVALVNTPFADINRPSLSFTQLKHMVEKDLPVEVGIHYLNQEFSLIFGEELYNRISEEYMTGLGDWIFRHLAFPDSEDNVDKYMMRHFPMQDEETLRLKAQILEKRELLSDALDEMIVRFNLGDADLVGFSSMFSQNVASFAMAYKLKQLNKDVVIVMGGANCESPMGDEIARCVPQVDFVFSGPATISFTDLVGNLIKGDRASCHMIDGVLSNKNIKQDGAVKKIGKEKPIDEYIPLNYDSFIDTFDKNFPQLSKTKRLLFETSRGCWWGERSHCTFCGLNSESMRYRSMDKEVAVEQFESMFKYADSCHYFSSVDNILPQKYTRDVIPDVKSPANISIFYEVKPSLKEEEIKLLADKSIDVLQPGIEALATSTLKLMKKGSNAFGNIDFLKNSLRHGVSVEWNLLVGFPGEQEDVYKKYMEDLPDLVHLPAPSGCFPVRFDRFSPYHKEAETFGLDLVPYEFYNHIYPFSKESIKNLAYYFQDKNYNADYARQLWKWISPMTGVVQEWIDLWDHDNVKEVPELYFLDVETIYDTRFNEPKDIKISNAARQLLGVLNKARTTSSLRTATFGLEGIDIESELSLLRQNRLLFEEDGKYISLVMSEKSPKPTEYQLRKRLA